MDCCMYMHASRRWSSMNRVYLKALWWSQYLYVHHGNLCTNFIGGVKGNKSLSSLLVNLMPQIRITPLGIDLQVHDIVCDP